VICPPGVRNDYIGWRKYIANERHDIIPKRHTENIRKVAKITMDLKCPRPTEPKVRTYLKNYSDYSEEYFSDRLDSLLTEHNNRQLNNPNQKKKRVCMQNQSLGARFSCTFA